MFAKLKDNRIAYFYRLAGMAFGGYKRQIIILTILGFVGGILEGIGINSLVPLFSFVLDDTQAGTDVISQAIKQFFGFFQLNMTVTGLLVLISVLFILKAIVTLIIDYIQIRIAADYEERTRTELFQKTLAADWPYLIQQKVGYLETILMVDVTSSAYLLRLISGTIMTLTGLIIYLIIAVNISLVITLTTILLGLIMFLIIKPLVYKTRKVSDKRQQTNKLTAHHVNENIIGIKAVKTMMAADGVQAKGVGFFKLMGEYWVKATMYESTSIAFLQPVSVIFVGVVFAYSYHTPFFNFAALVAILYLINRIFTYIQQLQRNWHKLNAYFPHLKAVLELQNEAGASKETDNGTKPFAFTKQLEFNNVTFGYSQSSQPTLKNVTLKINKGAMVGIIGPSGVGKTTLVDLILRLFGPTSGTITIDGRPIDEIDIAAWRGKIGYVSQDIFLMNDTVANNIKFYNEVVTEEQMIAAAKQANIYEFIESLPEKFNTVIGERGVLVSAGQRQRIVIARILARQPELLILDEATSALDNESEAKIQEVIENLKGKITVIVIAHRLSTIMDADELIVLENGTVAETGKPKELLKDRESYFFRAYNIR